MIASVECSEFDVAIATDLRFPGGSSGSTLEEVLVHNALGWTTALFHTPSPVLKRRRPFHHGIAEALIAQRAILANLIDTQIKSTVLIVRHPSIVHNNGESLPNVSTDHVILVVNHPPINSEGRIDYILPYAVKRLQETYGVAPRVQPIGPLVRASIDEMYGDAVTLDDTDWTNVFDIRRFQHRRQPPRGGVLRIGRHSRPGKEKWLNTAEALNAAYPLRDDVEIHVLGGSQAPESVLGYRPKNWIVYDFGAISSERFLRNIDVFVYFHHPRWVEAFGRVIVEAMASGLPTVVPHHFKGLLGDAAIYCEPEEVNSVIDKLKNPIFYTQYSNKAASYSSRKFSHETHIQRMAKFGLHSRVQPLTAGGAEECMGRTLASPT
jgi:glycosyltransferase involved in cell wall biosynthesis